jgi:hypothetical protein
LIRQFGRYDGPELACAWESRDIDSIIGCVANLIMGNYWHDDPMYGTLSKLERDEYCRVVPKIGSIIGAMQGQGSGVKKFAAAVRAEMKAAGLI